MADYNGYAYPMKDRKIKIFKLTRRKSLLDRENEIIVKEYQHPQEKFLSAYVRQIVAKESYEQDVHQSVDEYLIVINYREGINENCYIEFKNKTLRVKSVDNYEDRGLESKLVCQLVEETVEVNEITEKAW